MDMHEKDRCNSVRSEDDLDYNSAKFSDCRFINQSISLVSRNPSLTVGCSSIFMDDPFSTGLWNLSTSSTNLELCKDNLPEGAFMQKGSGILSPNPSHFPADSVFIERAANFSCFNASDSGGMMSPVSAIQSQSPCAHASRDHSRTQIHQGEPTNLAAASGHSSSKGLALIKRKRSNEDTTLDQAQIPQKTQDDSMKFEQKAERNSSTSATANPKGKHVKDSSESSKEDALHVRARRGQAINSHSLAERLRREKINERMKLLQDLVPGCSKVTGKAVMLDEIINYVQSLQQQVEFLSMKLAAVTPRLDIDMEAVLSKYPLQSCNGPSAAIAFSSYMMHPQLHLAQQGLFQDGLSGIRNSQDLLRRLTNSQMTAVHGYKEPKMRVPNSWDEECYANGI